MMILVLYWDLTKMHFSLTRFTNVVYPDKLVIRASRLQKGIMLTSCRSKDLIADGRFVQAPSQRKSLLLMDDTDK
jgi:hypothetical protein